MSVETIGLLVGGSLALAALAVGFTFGWFAHEFFIKREQRAEVKRKQDAKKRLDDHEAIKQLFKPKGW